MNNLARACASKSSLWWLTELIRRAILRADDPYEALLAADVAFSAQPFPSPEGGFDIRLADSEGVAFATEARGRAVGPFQGPSGRWFTKRKDGSVAPLSAPEGTHPTRRWPRAPEDEPGPVDDLLELIREVLSENDYPWARQAALDLIEGRVEPEGIDAKFATATDWKKVGTKGNKNIWYSKSLGQRRTQVIMPGTRGKKQEEEPASEQKPAEQENERPAAPPEKPEGQERTVEQTKGASVGTPEQKVLDAVNKVGFDGIGRVKVWQVRQAAGLSPEEFRSALRELRHSDQLRLIAVGDRSSMTPEDREGALQGENETFVTIERGEKYQEPSAEQKPESAPAGPPAELPTPQPQPAEPAPPLLTQLNLRNGLRMDAENRMPFTGQAIDGKGHRICYAAGIRTTCPGKDGKPPRGKPNLRPSIEEVTAALDAAYAGGSTEQIEDAAQLMGQLRVVELQQLRKARGGKYNRVKPLILQAIQATYQPQQTATPAPEAAPEQQPPAPEPQQAAQQPPQAAPAPEPAQTPPAPAAQPQTPPQAPEKGLLEAFQKLAPAGRGMVSFIDLQKATGLPTEQLHQAFARLQQEGVLSGVTLEGRHGVSPEEQAIALEQPGLGRVGYVTVRDEEKLKRALGGAQQPPGGQAAPQSTLPPAPVAKPPGSAQGGPINLQDESSLESAISEVAGDLPHSVNREKYDPSNPAARGQHKVYVKELYDALAPRLGGASLDDFKKALYASSQYGSRKLELLRDDLNVHPHLSSPSEIKHHLGQATFHTVNVAPLIDRKAVQQPPGGQPAAQPTQTPTAPAASPPAPAQAPPMASVSDVRGGFISKATERGVRLDHDYEGGKQYLEENGGELISSKQGVDGRTIETWRVRKPDGDLLATWGRGGVKTGTGQQLPEQWQFLVQKGGQTPPTVGAGAPDRLSPTGEGSTPSPTASVAQRIASGDVKAQQELLASPRIQQKISATTTSLFQRAGVKDKNLAEDLAQNVNVKLLEAFEEGKFKPGSGDPAVALEKYTSRIIVNAVRDYFRHQKVVSRHANQLKALSEAMFRQYGKAEGGQFAVDAMFSLGDGLSLNPAIARPAALELILDTLADSPAGPDGKPSDEAWGESQQILDWLGEQDSQQEPLQLPDLLMIPEDARA